jgi:hypothetical protein
MKKCMILILVGLLIPSIGLCAGAATSVSFDTTGVAESNHEPEIRKLIFECTGDSITGAITNKTINEHELKFIKGWCLVGVEVYPTPGGIAPNAASIFILDDGGMDLLGSEDGGTTPYAGLNLIHATLKRRCFPNLYIPRAGLHTSYRVAVTGLLTLKVIDQITGSANWTVALIFSR